MASEPTQPVDGSARAPDREAPTSPRFGDWQKLASSGQAEVWSAWDRELAARVAVKALPVPEPEAALRFRTEFGLAGQVHHPNVVQLFELFAEGDRWFFTMELIQGEPISAALGDPALRRGAFRGLCAGLLAIHDSGSIHLDIKPANVLVEEGGRVVVLDLGLAMPADPGSQALRARLGFWGAAGWMAPERRRREAGTAAADWWGAGALLFEGLTGLHLSDVPEPAWPELLGCCGELGELCLRLIAQVPERRPSDEEMRAWAQLPAPRTSALGERAEELRRELGQRPLWIWAQGGPEVLLDLRLALMPAHPLVVRIICRRTAGLQRCLDSLDQELALAVDVGLAEEGDRLRRAASLSRRMPLLLLIEDADQMDADSLSDLLELVLAPEPVPICAICSSPLPFRDGLPLWLRQRLPLAAPRLRLIQDLGLSPGPAPAPLKPEGTLALIRAGEGLAGRVIQRAMGTGLAQDLPALLRTGVVEVLPGGRLMTRGVAAAPPEVHARLAAALEGEGMLVEQAWQLARSGAQAEACRVARAALAGISEQGSPARFLEVVGLAMEGVVGAEAADLWSRRARALDHLGRGGDSARAWQAALEACPDRSDLELAAIEHWMRAGELPQGRALLERSWRRQGRAWPSPLCMVLDVVGGMWRLWRGGRPLPGGEGEVPLLLAGARGLAAASPLESAWCALRALSRAADAGDRAGQVGARALVLGSLLVPLQARLGAWPERLLEETRGLARDDPGLVACVDILEGHSLLYAGRWVEAERSFERGEQVLRRAEEGRFDWELNICAMGRLRALEELGRVEDFIERAGILYREALDRGDRYAHITAALYLGAARLMQDLPAAAWQMLGEAEERITDSFIVQRAYADRLRASILLVEERPVPALSLAQGLSRRVLRSPLRLVPMLALDSALLLARAALAAGEEEQCRLACARLYALARPDAQAHARLLLCRLDGQGEEQAAAAFDAQGMALMGALARGQPPEGLVAPQRWLRQALPSMLRRAR